MAKTARRRANAAGTRKGPAASRSKKGEAKTRAPKEAPRVSPLDIKLGTGPDGKPLIAYIRFDTPKSSKLLKLVTADLKKTPAAERPSLVARLFELLKSGLESESRKNLFKKGAAPADINLQAAIEKWAKATWPEAEDRPALKQLIFRLIGTGFEAKTHQPASSVESTKRRRGSKDSVDVKQRKAIKRAGSPHDPTERTKGGNPKRRRKAAAKAAGTPASSGSSRRIVDQEEPPPVDVDQTLPNDDAEKEPDEA